MCSSDLWSSHLPSGEGLHAFATPEDVLTGIDRINSDYAAQSRRAREIAAEHFSAGTVLGRLLDTCGR